jgi:undecaprenyl-diphosphatase
MSSMIQAARMKHFGTFLKKHQLYFLCAVFMAAFIVLAWCMANNKTSTFDASIYDALSVIMSPALTWFFMIVTNLGGFVVLLLLAIAVPLVVFKKKELVVLLLTNLAVVSLINLILKEVFARPRPQILTLIQEAGYSFPSGHAMASMAFYGLLIYLVWRMAHKTHQTSKDKSRSCKTPTKTIKIIATATLSVLILLIGVSRVYLGVHYASDVLAGFCLSLALLMLFVALYPKIERRFLA